MHRFIPLFTETQTIFALPLGFTCNWIVCNLLATPEGAISLPVLMMGYCESGWRVIRSTTLFSAAHGSSLATPEVC